MDLAEFRASFPVTAERTYLFSGGVAPASRPVLAALDAWVQTWIHDPSVHFATRFGEWDAVRGRLGRLLGCDASSIALTDNTSRASNLAAALVEAPPGANVVVDETVYASSLYPWLLPSRRHVEVRRARRAGRDLRIDDFARLVDDRTVAISVSHVSHANGHRHDLGALSALAHEHGALLIVDAAQSAGAVRVDVQEMGIDLLSGLSMKWLLGPPGVGFLYVHPRILEHAVPLEVGHVGAKLTGRENDPGGPMPLTFAPGGRRFEVGMADLAAIAAFRAALDLLLDVGMDRIEAQVLRLSGRIIEGLASRGIPVPTPSDPRLRAGVVSVPAVRAPELERFLRERLVDTCARKYPPFGDLLRVDPHGFNNDDDVDRFFEGIDAFVGAFGLEAIRPT
jgi:cysteine desulfurase / selenocysteine lyase